MKYFILILTTFFSRLQIDKCEPGHFDYSSAILCILSGLCCLTLIFYDIYKRKQIIRLDILITAILSANVIDKFLPYIIQNTLSIGVTFICIFTISALNIYLIKIGWNGTVPTDYYNFRRKI